MSERTAVHCLQNHLTEDHKMLLTNLIRGRVQAQQVTVAPL